MEQLFEKKHARFLFLLCTSLAIILLITIRYIIMPSKNPKILTGWSVFWSNTAESLFTGLVSSILIALLVYFMTPENVRKAKIESIEQKELKHIFESEAKNSDEWWYKGGCGRYTRTVTIPNLAKNARDKSERITAHIVLLDPTNESVCEKHAEFRRGTASASVEGTKWSTSLVRNELYATIITALVTQQEQPLFRANIHLIPYYSLYRTDISSNYAILTKEDRQSPAIKFDKSSSFYKSYKDDIILSQNQGKKITDLSGDNYSLAELDGKKVSEIITKINLRSEHISEEDFNSIAKICVERKNPYG